MKRDSLLLRLVLLVSCSHAMVHLLEQSIASVELNVSAEYGFSPQQSGLLSTAFRLPYGFGAFLAGILADRLGARNVLVAYLTGAGITCLAIPLFSTATLIYVLIFVLGCFASIYHPAGLALLANSTTIGERSRALGVHGVFGSTGIAAAPFFAGLTLSVPSITWKGYYVLLALFCGALALLLARFLKALPGDSVESLAATLPVAPGQSSMPPVVVHTPPRIAPQRLQKTPFVLLILSAGTSGIVYGGFLHFLTRYLSEVPELNRLVGPSYFTAIALLCGAAGQYVAGRIATPRRLPLLLTTVYAANAPFLLWMAVADGVDRLIATCLLAFVHFMNQPLYNSLLPEFIPPSQRSTWFGFSNLLGFGLGAVGPWFVGSFTDYQHAYAWLAAVALVAAVFPFTLSLQLTRVQKSDTPRPGQTGA